MKYDTAKSNIFTVNNRCMCPACGYEIIKVYEEEESAWRNGYQRELANLIVDARKRRFQAVLVWALGRLSGKVLWQY
jgi:DNA invertase Pin-like site-specific DNA recombinase